MFTSFDTMPGPSKSCVVFSGRSNSILTIFSLRYRDELSYCLLFLEKSVSGLRSFVLETGRRRRAFWAPLVIVKGEIVQESASSFL